MTTHSRSRWNRFLDHRLEVGAELTADGHRLADALMRSILGWNKTEERLGREYLRELTGLHGRSLDRGIANLLGVGLIVIEKGGRGRGKRTLYRLIFEPEEMPPSRGLLRPRKKPPWCGLFWTQKMPPKKAALARRRKGLGEPLTRFPLCQVLRFAPNLGKQAKAPRAPWARSPRNGGRQIFRRPSNTHPLRQKKLLQPLVTIRTRT
jgi:hypothetical protein